MNFIPVELNIYVPYPSFFPFFHLPEYISPFAEKAKAAGKRYTGGKLDDTTAIVARIQIPFN